MKFIYKPKQNIWIITIITSIINLLNRFVFGINDKLAILIIYLAGFILIGVLSYIYYLESRIKEKMDFLREMVKTEEIQTDGTKKVYGKIDANSIKVVEALADLK